MYIYMWQCSGDAEINVNENSRQQKSSQCSGDYVCVCVHMCVLYAYM
jgi:hypothetical protein